MDWLLCEDILMRNWISVLEGGYRPKAVVECLQEDWLVHIEGVDGHERPGPPG